MKNRILSVVMAMAMFWAIVPTTVSVGAADGDFTIMNSVLTKYNGAGGDVVIPDGVTSIGTVAFRDCTSLTSITIVIDVKLEQLENASFCISVTLSGIVTDVRLVQLTNARYPILVTLSVIPDSVKEIKYGAFRECKNLKSAIISNSVTNIEQSLFFNCISLISIAIPI